MSQYSNSAKYRRTTKRISGGPIKWIGRSLVVLVVWQFSQAPEQRTATRRGSDPDSRTPLREAPMLLWCYPPLALHYPYRGQPAESTDSPRTKGQNKRADRNRVSRSAGNSALGLSFPDVSPMLPIMLPSPRWLVPSISKHSPPSRAATALVRLPQRDRAT